MYFFFFNILPSGLGFELPGELPWIRLLDQNPKSAEFRLSLIKKKKSSNYWYFYVQIYDAMSMSIKDILFKYLAFI